MAGKRGERPQEDDRKGLCDGHGENGLCRLAATLDGRWCPWHWGIVVLGHSKAGGFEDFERWLETQRTAFHDYRWQLHTPAAWWDLVNGRPTAEIPYCDGCGRNLLSPVVMAGTQPILDRLGKFCSPECWHPAYLRRSAEDREAARAEASA